MYESSHQTLLPRKLFLQRMAGHLFVAFVLVAVSLGIGMAGYMAFEKQGPLDAFLNASMLLGGMGPVDLPKSNAGKFFAGCYALYAGLIFLVTAALVITPVLHRVMHHFHMQSDDKRDKDRASRL